MKGCRGSSGTMSEPRPEPLTPSPRMDAFVINGGQRLRGSVRIHGSKNAALPLMAAALLTDEPLMLRDVPDLADIRNMKKLLATLGCQIKDPSQANGDCELQATDRDRCLAHYDLVRTMRAGICVLGPLLGRRGRARVSMPGGCAIGDRPVDLHLRGLRSLGANIHLDEGYIVAKAPGGRLCGTHVFLGGPNGSTVLGTANIMSAAVLAEGRTIIESAACEPEIEDLQTLLNSMGAQVRGGGSPVITIDGVNRLGGATHDVIPDRIEAGTFICAAAITNGDVTLENFPTRSLTAALDRFHEAGVQIDSTTQTNNRLRETVRAAADRVLRPVHVVTQPHPGFPTDLQAQIMALLCLADGNSIITEKIFPDRFLHVAELMRMGASLIRSGPSVMVAGTRELTGAPVMASDLRASAGLVLAGLAARGQTIVNRVYHLDRGYERMEDALRKLGADIQRVDERDL